MKSDKIVINTLLIGALFISVYSIWADNSWIGVIYLVLLSGSAVLMSYSYCAKCAACQKKCGHPQFGIFRKFVPKRDIAKYQTNDYLGLLPFIIVAIVLPQFWLWQTKTLFSIFWVLLSVAGAGILTRLCKKCVNTNCPFNRNPDAACV